MPKSAADRLAALQSYCGGMTPNPLIDLRREHNGFTQQDMATYLGVNRGVVNSAEDAMFSLIPACYRKHIPMIMETNAMYQAHRKEKREILWDINDFPGSPSRVDPMGKLVEHFEMSPYKFGANACVHHSEIFLMKKTKRQMTENFHGFLKTVGLPDDWIRAFNAGLAATHPGAVLRR